MAPQYPRVCKELSGHRPHLRAIVPSMRRWLFAAAAVAIVLMACGADDAPTNTAGSSGTGSVTVFGAASLTEAFTAEQAALATEQPGLSITFNFQGSGALVTQILQGAPADVVATADTASMAKLVDAGMVEAPVAFARNKLEILVAPGNPKHVMALADLARDDITFVTEDDSVPAGKYVAQALAAKGVTTHPVSKEADVKSAVAKVTTGEADATIVYATDVAAAGAKGEGVTIPDVDNVVAEYPIAVVKSTKHRGAALAFVDAVAHGSGQAVLSEHGFLSPD